MSWPTKILPFKKPLLEVAETVRRAGSEAFPRFRKEWERPAAISMVAVAGFAIPPAKGK